MAVQNSNFNTLITAIDTKAQSLAASTTDPKDLVYLAKSLESLNVTATVSDVIAAGDTKVTAVNTAGTTQVAAVQAEGSTQVAAVAAAGSGYATSGNVDALRNIILVTVAGGKLVMDGTSQQALKLTPSVKYRFDQSDSSNATHPLQFSITDDGTHGSGAALTAGITVVGTAGSANSYVEITLEQDAVETYYYCGNHAAMGGTAYTTTVAGGGGAGEYTGTLRLDAEAFDLTNASRHLVNTNLTSYMGSMRIRGLDTATKAYFGINLATMNSTPATQMSHSFAVFSANQTSGAISQEGVINVHNNTNNGNDYSTFTQYSDEWTGRYSYVGHIPLNNGAHAYSYHKVLITSPTTKDSTHTSSSTYIVNANDRISGGYVAPAERRLGGAVTQSLPLYISSSGKAAAVEFNYAYSATQLNVINQWTHQFTTTMTSTCYNVSLHQQWDATTAPYYTQFMSFQEGIYARRANGTWDSFASYHGISIPISRDHNALFLSNGGVVLQTDEGSAYLINSSGGVSLIASNTLRGYLNISGYKYQNRIFNVGTDEWLQALPGGKFVKWTINPATGAMTVSNTLISPEVLDSSYDTVSPYRRGFWSGLNPAAGSAGHQMFTFGNENSTGHGYGKSKLMHIGGFTSTKKIYVVTYDIATLVSTLAYP